MTLRATRSVHGWRRRGTLALLALAIGLAIPSAWTPAASATELGEVTEFKVPLEGETQGITAGAEGDLWFTQSNVQMKSGQVGRITPTGEITEFPTGITSFPSESGITTGLEGDLWFDHLSGQGVGRMTPSGEGTDFPDGGGEPELVAITTGSEGNLWFTQDSVGSIGEMTPTGVVTPVPTGNAWTTPNFDTQGITTGPEGDIWFTEYSAHAIGRATPGGVVTKFTSGIPSGAEPTAIVSGPEGDLWFTEDGSEFGIGRITPSGSVKVFNTGKATARPDGIAAGTEGDLWFTEFENGKITRFTPSGEITRFQTGNPESGSDTPEAITAGPEGNMWFTQGESNEIGRIYTGGGAARPAVTKLTPNDGSAEGGSEVTITGLNLEGVEGVSFGSTPALEVTPVSANTVIAIAPPGVAGKTVNVTVSTSAGSSPISRGDRFKYDADPLKLTPKALKLATAGVPYADTLHGIGGTEPYDFKVVSGTLPAGIELTAGGELTGTPEAAGTSTFVVKVSDSSLPMLTATRQYTLETQLDITPSSLGRMTAGSTVSKEFAVTGGTPPYTLVLTNLTSIGLEFSFDALTGQGLLSGVPAIAGSYTLTAEATDGADPQNSGTRTFKVKVGLGLLPAALPGATVGTAYETGIEVLGGSGSYAYNVSEGTLPAGLELGASSGRIEGTPTEAGKSKFAVTVTDHITGLTATIKYHLKVAP